MLKKTSSLCLAVFVLGCASVLLAGFQQSPTFRSAVSLVRVDVIVTDAKGNPVNDLRPEDFEITEDKHPQSISSFKLIDVMKSDAQPPLEPLLEVRNPFDERHEAAREDARIFAVFIDDYHISKATAFQRGAEVAAAIESQFRPADLSGVMYPLTPLSDFHLSHDRRIVGDAIRTLKGRSDDTIARNTYEENAMSLVGGWGTEPIRAEVSASALKALIVHLGGLTEGRKTIIWISDGSSAPVPVGGRISLPPVLRSPGSSARGLSMFEDDYGRSVVDLANQYNVAIDTLDPVGLRGGSSGRASAEYGASDANPFGMPTGLVSAPRTGSSGYWAVGTGSGLAENTNGRGIRFLGNFERQVAEAFHDSSAYYLIAYESTQARPDGKFHEIHVRVKRPGVNVRARKGYMALTPREYELSQMAARPGPPAAIQNALGDLQLSSRRNVIKTWVGMSPAASGKTAVTFVWQLTPQPAQPKVANEQKPARVTAVARSDNAVPLADAQDVRSDQASRMVFEVPPGPLELRIGVENTNQDILDRQIRQIDVVDFTKPALTMSTPQLFDARSQRDWLALAGNRSAMPSADREFRRTDHLLIRVGARTAHGDPADVTARLLNRNGQEMRVLTSSPAGFDGLTNVDVSLADLAAGEYLVEITAADGATDASTLVPIRIIP